MHWFAVATTIKESFKVIQDNTMDCVRKKTREKRKLAEEAHREGKCSKTS